MNVNEQRKPKREAPQTKAKRLAAEYYNDHCKELERDPVDVKDVRILMWRNVVQENIWSVILWITFAGPTFFVVTHDKSKDETTLQVYTDYVTEMCS